MTTIDLDKAIALFRGQGQDVVADMLAHSQQALSVACRSAGFEPAAETRVMKVQVAAEKHQCGGACGDPHCDGSSCGMGGGMGGGIVVPMLIPDGAIPACYSCKPVDACLSPAMRMARSRFDLHGWFALWTTDPAIIHINKSVGAAPYAANVPIATNGKVLYAMEDAQQLPFLPGLFKVDFGFTDKADLASNVSLRVFTGARGLTGLTSTSGLNACGGTLKLSDFKCGEDCFLIPFPRLLTCIPDAIPDTRAVYVEVEAHNLAGKSLETLNVTLLKRHTKQCEALCNKWELEL